MNEELEKNWNEPDMDGNVNVPDYLDALTNKVGFQIRFHTISGKNEIQTICDIVYLAEKFFTDLATAQQAERVKELEEALKYARVWIQPHSAKQYALEVIDNALNKSK